MGLTSRRCRTCRAEIYQIKGPAGKYIPAQKVRTVYHLVAELPGLEGEPELQRVQTGEFWVSHFETCPDAAEHSRG